MWQPGPVLVRRSEPGRTTFVYVDDRPPVDLSTLIACMTCRATVLQSCRVVDGDTVGRRKAPHAMRFAPKLCACGSIIGHRAQLCPTCAAESLRASKRDHMRRRRAAA